MRIAYFVHNVHDPAVKRRLTLLRLGGATVDVIGFRRTDERLAAIGESPVTDLGRTEDAKLTHRALSVAGALLKTPALAAQVRGCDLILARNLEMLAIASAARRLHAPTARLVYECLDVHRSLLGDGAPSRLLRAAERALLAGCGSVAVSSPAFVDSYFLPRQKLKRPTLLIENRLVERALAEAAPNAGPPAGAPWTVGWFGVIRCQKSLDMLCAAAEACGGRLRVVIRGRPALHEFRDFNAQIGAAPHVSFEGAYDPTELAALYGGVHFTWALDYFEEGGNSSWLLPNRIYEGGRHGAPALAQDGVEVGRWVDGRGAGLLLSQPLPDLVALIDRLTPEAYLELRRGVRAIPPETFVYDQADCRRLVSALAARETA